MLTDVRIFGLLRLSVIFSVQRKLIHPRKYDLCTCRVANCFAPCILEPLCVPCSPICVESMSIDEDILCYFDIQPFLIWDLFRHRFYHSKFIFMMISEISLSLTRCTWSAGQHSSTRKHNSSFSSSLVALRLLHISMLYDGTQLITLYILQFIRLVSNVSGIPMDERGEGEREKASGCRPFFYAFSISLCYFPIFRVLNTYTQHIQTINTHHIDTANYYRILMAHAV